MSFSSAFHPTAAVLGCWRADKYVAGWLGKKYRMPPCKRQRIGGWKASVAHIAQSANPKNRACKPIGYSL